MPFYLHPFPQPGRPSEADYDITHTFGWPYETVIALTRLVFSGIMERHPRLKIVSHHLGGGMIPFFMGRVLETNDQSGVYPDKAAAGVFLPVLLRHRRGGICRGGEVRLRGVRGGSDHLRHRRT